MGATLIEVLDNYADDLAKVGGRQLRHAGKLDLDHTVLLVPATAVLGASTEQAVASANAWLGSTHGGTQPHTQL